MLHVRTCDAGSTECVSASFFSLLLFKVRVTCYEKQPTQIHWLKSSASAKCIDLRGRDGVSQERR